MPNRHQLFEDNKPNELNQHEVMRTLADAGYENRLLELLPKPVDSLMSGDVSFDTLTSGLRFHCTDVVEQSTGQIVSELQPMISINVLLEGQVNFSLNNCDYVISSEQDPVIFVNLITQPTLFKRQFSAGNRVKKINISLTRSWLLAHCRQRQDQHVINQLFSAPTSCRHWPASSEFQSMAQRLIKLHEQHGLLASMEKEQLALQMVILCYQEFLTDQHRYGNAGSDVITNNSVAIIRYEEQLTKLIHEPLTLEQIASRLGASISTLQRYFKRTHQVTLKNYIRNQKLEHARRLLIFDRKSIGEVAYAIGYNHPSNFIKAFKSYFAITPAELKRQYLY